PFILFNSFNHLFVLPYLLYTYYITHYSKSQALFLNQCSSLVFSPQRVITSRSVPLATESPQGYVFTITSSITLASSSVKSSGTSQKMASWITLGIAQPSLSLHVSIALMSVALVWIAELPCTTALGACLSDRLIPLLIFFCSSHSGSLYLPYGMYSRCLVASGRRLLRCCLSIHTYPLV